MSRDRTYEGYSDTLVPPDKALGSEFAAAVVRAGATRGRRQEEWYKRRTADRVFAALDAKADEAHGLKLNLSGSADSGEWAKHMPKVPTVPETTHRHAFNVREVQEFLKPNALELIRSSEDARFRKNFIEWTLALSCVYVHGIDSERDIPSYDLRYVGHRRSSLEPIVRVTYGGAKYDTYTAEENGSLAAFLTVMLMIKALEFAHQCSLVGKDESLYSKISSPFAVKPESPLYNMLVRCAAEWEMRRNLKNLSDIVDGMKTAARGFGRSIPDAVFSGLRRVDPTHVLEYIPMMTQEEFAFLMTIPDMCVRVDGKDYNGEKPRKKTGAAGPLGTQGPFSVRITSRSVVFYHLPIDRLPEYSKAENLAKKITEALNRLEIDELRIRKGSRVINAYGGVPMWGSAPFLEEYRQKMAAYEQRRRRSERKEKSEGCTIL